jgi:hypothetical protein
VYPRISNKGNKYICILCVYDPNYIKRITIKSRHSLALLKAYTTVYEWYKKRGCKTTFPQMDNGTSADVENFTAYQNTGIQYTAPGRRYVSAEKAVQMYKSCYKSTTVSFPSEFPAPYLCVQAPTQSGSVRQHHTSMQT